MLVVFHGWNSWENLKSKAGLVSQTIKRRKSFIWIYVKNKQKILMNNSSRKASALHLSSKWLKSSKRWERNQKGCGKKMAKLVKFSNLIMIVSFPLYHLVSNWGALIYQSHKRKIKIANKLNKSKRKNVNYHCLIVQLEDK